MRLQFQGGYVTVTVKAHGVQTVQRFSLETWHRIAAGFMASVAGR